VYAARYGHTSIVTLLLSHGVSLKNQSDNSRDVLSAAVRSRNILILKLLINAGQDSDAKDEVHGQALLTASAHVDITMIQILLDAGADVNFQLCRDNALRTISANGNF
jgi:ankyrin repeat protein